MSDLGTTTGGRRLWKEPLGLPPATLLPRKNIGTASGKNGEYSYANVFFPFLFIFLAMAVSRSAQGK